jgi:hypothetical protein
VNQTLPPSEQIRVWLGEPPVDWAKIKTPADLNQSSERDQYPAELIKAHILARSKKALVIYGSVHFFALNSLEAVVEQSYPESFFVIIPYTGFPDQASSEAFERTLQLRKNQLLTKEGPKANTLLLRTQKSQSPGDALLYLGPASTLTKSAVIPDLNLDSDFRREINRRSAINFGKPLDSTIPSVSPENIHK